MRHVAGLLACLVLAASLAHAQNLDEPGTLTIRIFSTRLVKSVTFIPINANGKMRACPQCKEATLSSPLSLELARGEIRSSADKELHRTITLRGAFRIRLEGTPQTESAAGQWTVSAASDGMRVLLTTSTERYVMAALNGEAAPDEPLESLKAMAVATRTFALVNQRRHSAEGFNLCDSTHCQALRFGATRPEVEQAVRETAGETLWYGAHRAAIYMTQHCGGQTEDAADVWPGQHASYLRSHADPYCLRRSAATWHADIETAQALKIFQEQHWKMPARIDSIRVTKRTPSGRTQLLAIGGPDKTASVSAGSLRFALNRALGWNELRSNWYDVALDHESIHFEGRGYGHGVGLCQAGSFEMAAEGHSYRSILDFYFPETNVRIGLHDAGWQTTAGKGWSLMSTGASRDLLLAGDTAWAKALSLFPSGTQAHPVVYSMPSTELFRQATDEPGWMLASTRGNHVALQPMSILQARGGAGATLLHEFLHVLVEQESSQQTPLWLREGLVEWLAEGSAHAASPLSIAETEAALAHPASAEESRRAHLAAAFYAQYCVDRYGLAMVRSWLRAGLPPTVPAQLRERDRH